MTEAEWLSTDSAPRMIGWLLGFGIGEGELFELSEARKRRSSDRKLELLCEAIAPGLRPDRPGNWLLRWAQAARTREESLRVCSLLRDLFGNPFRPATLPQDKQLCGKCGGEDCTHEGGECRCMDCGSSHWLNSRAWLTPQVLALARAAYEQRSEGEACGRCDGEGRLPSLRPVSPDSDRPCPDCGGAGRVGAGLLDDVRLLVLADAMEEAGCTDEPLLRHLRGQRPCPVCRGGARQNLGAGEHCRECDLDGFRSLDAPHVRGCWAVDLLLGKS